MAGRARVRRLFFAGLGAVILLVNLPLIHRFLLRGEAEVTTTIPFADDFSGDGRLPGPAYRATGGLWRIVEGELLSPGVKNNPLWLKASLPADAVVEFEATSASPDGDIKFELFGDGFEHASGYVFIFGGWKNTLSVIARLDEHGADRVERSGPKVVPFQTYRMRVERRGGELRWLVDGELFLELSDAEPLRGPGHDRFGFSSWDAELTFDELRIAALPPEGAPQ